MKVVLFFAVLFLSLDSHSQSLCRDLFINRQTKDVFTYLESRYGVSRDKLDFTPDTKTPVLLRTSSARNLRPKIDSKTPIVREMKKYDVVVVGGGPSGLTSALYLAEAGKSVLVIERNPQLGGIGLGNELKGIQAGGGAAYSTGPDGGLEYKVFQKIGLGAYKKKLSITEPIDSYLWKGRLYKGVWEEHTLTELPYSFTLFKHALLKLAKQGANDGTTDKGQWADSIDTAALIRQMPQIVKNWKDAESKKIFEKYENEVKNLPEKDPMVDVIDFLDLYGRSALGAPMKDLSARMMIDFYESEVSTRYTGTLGTGTISAALLKKLSKFSNVTFKTSAPVASVENTADGTRTVFFEDGFAKEVVADKVIYATAVTSAPHLIKDLGKLDPEKLKIINEIQQTDYAVHVVRLKGHPFRATYDTWVFGDRDLSKPTDYILGRWQDSRIQAYQGMREFQRDPIDDYGVISIYQPMGPSKAKNFDKAETLKLVESALEDLFKKFGPLVARDGQKFQVELVETYRWPESIHIVSPGYFKKSPILARETGNIHYANNTVGAPEIESSLARGAQTAINILALEKKLKPTRRTGN